MTIQHWHKIIDINLMGAIYCTLAAYPIMIKQRAGHIVNIASETELYSVSLMCQVFVKQMLRAKNLERLKRFAIN